MQITLPHNWRPRGYQMPAWGALERGVKRMVLIWHRRSGKDDLALHWTCAAMMQRPGTYWHMLPEASQSRKAIWDAVDGHVGIRRIDWVFPKELRRRTLEHQMQLELANGSMWQVLGSDNYDSLVGSPPVGVVFSEYALANPNAWAMLRPILAENGGWAIFITTPRGRNHAHRIYELARHDPAWFGQLLTVEDTKVISREIIETERREVAKERGDDEADAFIGQEYFCNFDAPVAGAYYARLLALAEAGGRVGSVPYDPRHPVTTAWDLGVGDSTAIWFMQQIGLDVHLIDYYEASGVGADHYAKVIREKDYAYTGHILPHDANDREWGNNASSRVDVLKSLGVKPHRILARASVDDGINAARMLIQRAKFDPVKCERGLDALRNYQRRWDDTLKIFSQNPLHDWSSHGADAFRYLAQGIRDVKVQQHRPDYAVM
jgi:phage terminase large subunit